MRTVRWLIWVLLTLASISAAQAFDTTTRWYTLGTQPLWQDGQPLFLTTTADGVKLEPYRSGDATQMWAKVWPNFPGAVDVVFDEGILAGMLGCIGEWFGCDFVANTGNPVKIVSRASGRCLTFNGNGAVTVACDNSAPKMKKQLWEMFSDAPIVAGPYQPMVAEGRCLAGFNTTAALKTFYAGPSKCLDRPMPARMLFMGQLVAEISCQTAMSFNLCFKN